MNVLETEWWTLALPPEWWADSEDDSILVGDHDDVGCIEISTLHKEQGHFDRDAVLAIAQEESEHPLQWSSATLGEFSGLNSSYVEEEAAVREWYVSNGAVLLFITYSCEEENRGMDDAAVDEILDTLMLAGNST
ncbi:MAG: hypothetical protein P8L39_17035 [Halioglobus sp.]|nr:hypothetical protein [Halioglobus sp.]